MALEANYAKMTEPLRTATKQWGVTRVALNLAIGCEHDLDT
jgi:hypothetical protein